MDCYIHIRNNTLTKGGDKVVTEVRSSLFIQLFIYFISLNLFCKRQERNITHTHTHTYTQEINNNQSTVYIEYWKYQFKSNVDIVGVKNYNNISSNWLLTLYIRFDNPLNRPYYFKRDRQLIFLAVYKL